MIIRSKNHKFYLGVYDVINTALAGGSTDRRYADISRVGHRLTLSQAQAKAYRHRNLGWGGNIFIQRSKTK